MTLYTARAFGSDLPGDVISYKMTAGPLDGNFSTAPFTINALESRSITCFTEPGVPNNPAWEATSFLASVSMLQGQNVNRVELWISVARVSSSGSIIEQSPEEGPFGNDPGVVAEAISTYTFSAGDPSDRLAMIFRFEEKVGGSWTIEIQTGDPGDTFLFTDILSEGINPDPVALVLAAPAVTIEHALMLLPDPVALVLAAPAPALALTYALSPDPVALVLSIPTPDIIVPTEVTARLTELALLVLRIPKRAPITRRLM